MSPLKLAYRNLIYRPLNTGFNLLLLLFSSALISLGLLINAQFENHFSKNLGKTDLILTAKGSPLQAVLCNLFHIDFPTGNILLKDCKPFLRENHPIIQDAVPIALGDQYAGNRLVGTTLNYFSVNGLAAKTGELFTNDFQVVLGWEVAQNKKLNLGDLLTTGHGITSEEESNHLHDDHRFRVVGILQPSGTINDQLIFCTISSYWAMHHDEHAEDHSAHHHGPACLNNVDLLAIEGQITSLLLGFKGTNIQSLNFGRSINENTQLMAVNPAIELNRLYELTGTATEMMSWVVYALVAITMFSIFISLWQAMEHRKYELALLRFAGAKPSQLIGWIILESLLLCITGVLTGIAISHAALMGLDKTLQLSSRYGIRGDVFLTSEWILVGITCIFAILAALIPTLKATRADIHHLLSNES